MANFNIMLDTSNFKPFDYNEMIKPLLLYKQEEEARQKAYLELQDKIASLADLENSEKDSEHYNKYRAYNQELQDVVDSMAKYGLTRRNNKAFQLYKKYNAEIKPSQLLLDKRNELIKEQREMALKDPTLMFTINYADASLNDVKSNKGTYETISGELLYKMGKEQAAAASLRNISVGRRQELANQYFAIRKGYGAEAAQRFLENQSEIPELASAVNRIKHSTGTSRLQDDSRATDYILNGMMSGLAYDENYQADGEYMTKAQRNADARAKEQINLSRRAQDDRLAMLGMTRNADGSLTYDMTKDPSYAKARALAALKNNKPTSNNRDINKNTVMIGASTGNTYKGLNDEDGLGQPLEETNTRELSPEEYINLFNENGNLKNKYLKTAIGPNGHLQDYEIRVIDKGSTKINGTGLLWDDDLNEDVYVLIPRKSQKSSGNNVSGSGKDSSESSDEDYGEDDGLD